MTTRATRPGWWPTVSVTALSGLGLLALLGRSVRARRDAEDEQRRSSEQLARVIETSPVPTAITVIADGTILLANAAMLRALGWERDSLVGRTTTEIQLWASAENRQTMVELLARDGHIHQMEERLRRRDGTVFDVLTSIESIEFEGRQCLIGLFYDISDRVRVEEELRASQAQLQAFLTHLPSPAVLKDVEGRVLLANEAGAQAYDRPIEALSATTVGEAPPAPLLEDVRQREQGVLLGRSAVREEVVRALPDGTTRVVLEHRFPVLDQGEVVGVGLIATDVTALKALERQAQEAAERFRLLLDSSAEGIFGVDPEGRFMFVNPAAVEALGYAPDELLGSSVHALIHHHRGDGSEYPWEECPTYLTLHERTGWRTDSEQFWRKDGTCFPVEYSSQPLGPGDGGGAVVVFSDITERIAAEQTLRAYRSLFEHSLDGVLFTAPSGEIYSANAAACDILRMPEDEVRRRGRAGLADPTDDRWTAGAAERAQSGGFRGELRMRRGDGSTFVADVSSAVFEDEAGRQRASVIFRDVSDRAALLEEKAAAAAAAQEASTLKSEFLAMMSHEIRTPVNGVVGMTGLLLDTELGVEQREYAETVRSSAEALLVIVNDILDLSKIEAGRLELEEVDFDPGEVAEEVAELLAAAAHVKDVQLLVQIDPGAPALCCGDPARVRQVLTNLVGNAVKFTDRGLVQLTVTGASTEGAPSAVRFEVVDTGIGIGAEAQPTLFESFTQAEAATSRRFGGTGLGLAISKRLVDLMGGEIGVSSTFGEGSTFWCILPLRDAETLPPRQPRTLAGRRALVVDALAEGRSALSAQLAVWGLTVVPVGSGEEALTALRRAETLGERFDLVVADAQLPGLDGVELAEAGAQSLAHSPPMIVLFTSGGAGSARARSSTAVSRSMTKPVRRSQLFEAAATAMGVGPVRGAVAVPKPSAGGVARARLLVVDDNAVNQRLATLMLQRAGYQVDAVADGAEAVAAVLRGRYSAVIMDCEMPIMDGYAASAEIRRTEGPGERIPIIAVTASAMQADAERAIAAGMDAHVAKPIRQAELEAVLQRVLPGAAPEREDLSGAGDSRSVLQAEAVALLRGLDRDGEALRTLAEIFTRRAPEHVARVREAALHGDTEVLRVTAHTLLGSAATFGAESLADAARRMEVDAGAGVLPSPAALDELEARMHAALALLAEELAP